MPTDHDNNRSSAPTPEQIALTNSLVKACGAREAVTAVFASLKPVLQDMALTPEKLREANRPYEDPKKAARELRESLKSKQDEAQIQKDVAARRARCTHSYVNGVSAVNCVHNFFDNQPRGVCMICMDWITPREWRIGPPDAENPRGKPFLAPAHPAYLTVLQIDARN